MEELTILKSPGSPGNKHIHFIGIGGISMSGLAEVMLDFDYEVSGSDLKKSHITEKLAKKGVKVYPCHSEHNIKDPDMVVYTAAIKENNPELAKARKLKIPTIERCVLLGELSKKHELPIAVSGTHGKTTTTSMLAAILMEGNFDPTIHVGGELDIIGGTTRMGVSKYFLTEACEYNEGFLNMNPYLGIILNIEEEHPDYFKNIEEVKNTYLKFASQITGKGYLIACLDDQNLASILDELSCQVITYSLESQNANWTAKDIKFDEKGCAHFNLVKSNRVLTQIKLNVPGLHNVSNSLASIAASYALGCDLEDIRRGIYKFSGAKRRLEIKGVIDDIKIIDDYAHHPSEIKATLRAARSFCNSKIWCVFQPHTFSRTKAFFKEFSQAFTDADITILSDIYAAREKNLGEVHSRDLSEEINSFGNQAIYFSRFPSILKYLKSNAGPGDLIITMGAGDIYQVGEMFLQSKREPL